MDSEPGPRTPPARPPPPKRVLVLGDSMIVTELGRDLARQFEAHFGSQVTRWGKSSTGLARPDFFDWFEQGRRLAEATDPHVVVVIVGGNDGQDLVDAQGQGRVRWRSENWASRYGERVHQFLDAMAAPGRRFVWVELPAMELRSLENKLKLIRRVQREALDTRTDVLAQLGHGLCYHDRRGRIRTEVPTGRARGRPIRQEDGIHLTRAGARFISRCLFPHLLPEFSEADPRVSPGDDRAGAPVSSRAEPPERPARSIQR